MASYLTTSLLKFNRRIVDGMSISDYHSIDFVKIRDYIASLDKSFFDFYQCMDDDKWERISLELYNNPDYWDVLLVINDRHAFLGLPLGIDTTALLSDDKIAEYESLVYGKSLNTIEAELMYNKVEFDMVVTNEANRVIKIIKPAKMGTFITGIKAL